MYSRAPFYLNSDIVNENSNVKLEVKSFTHVVFNITWGGTLNDGGEKMALDKNGNLYIVGFTLSYGAGYSDFVVIKYHPNGTMIWNVTWGGSSYDFGRSIALDDSDNIYVAGDTKSYGAGDYDMALLKFYPNETMAWNTTFGGPDYDLCKDVTCDADGNIYLIGYTESYGAGNHDLVIVKYHPNGTKLWNITWGGPNDDFGRCIAVGPDNFLYATGHTYSYGAGNDDVVLIKYYLNGTKIWNVTFGGTNSDQAYSMTISNSGLIYITGKTCSFGDVYGDVLLVVFSSNGTKILNATWDGTSSDYGYDIALDSNNNVFVVGKTYSHGASTTDLVLVYFSENGNVIENLTCGGSDNDEGNGIIINDHDNIFVTGKTLNWGYGGYDIILLSYDFMKPWSDNPPDATYIINANAQIIWTLYDNVKGGHYAIYLNGTLFISWTSWNNNSPISINVDTSVAGTWNYTIMYYDSANNWGTPNTVIIIISSAQVTQPSIPGFQMEILYCILPLLAVIYFLFKKIKYQELNT